MSGIPDEEQQQLDQYVHMFDKLVEIAKILEEKIVTTASSRDVYPLMQTYNQIREVIADMRALRDMGSIGDRVNQEVLYPFVQSAAKDAGEFYQSITRQCKRLLPEEMFAQVDQLLREEFRRMVVSSKQAIPHFLIRLPPFCRRLHGYCRSLAPQAYYGAAYPRGQPLRSLSCGNSSA